MTFLICLIHFITSLSILQRTSRSLRCASSTLTLIEMACELRCPNSLICYGVARTKTFCSLVSRAAHCSRKHTAWAANKKASQIISIWKLSMLNDITYRKCCMNLLSAARKQRLSLANVKLQVAYKQSLHPEHPWSLLTTSNWKGENVDIENRIPWIMINVTYCHVA